MEKLLPQNMEAECGVLGSLIIDPDALVQVMDFLHGEDFYRDAHRTLYEVILQLYAQHRPADFITICDELARRNHLEEIGGASYITSLVNGVPTSGNVEYYGRIVERTGVLRRLIHSAGQIAATAYEEPEADVALDKAEQVIFAVRAGHTLGAASSPHIRDALVAYLDKLDRLSQQRSVIVGVPTGFAELDRLTGGLQRSDLILLAARPSLGKTSCALSLAHNAAVRYGRKVGIFSLEMSQEQVVQRFLAMDARVDQQCLRRGEVGDQEWDRIAEAMRTLTEVTLLIDDTAALSAMQMKSKARQWMVEYEGLDLLIVDYLQLMGGGGERRPENRVQVVDELSRQLKLLARELDIPILALAQLSRAVELRQSKVPQLSDLRESGGLENNADLVLFIYRDEVYNPESERRNLADIIVAKHRNGPVGETTLYFDKSHTRFRDVEGRTLPTRGASSS